MSITFAYQCPDNGELVNSRDDRANFKLTTIQDGAKLHKLFEVLGYLLELPVDLRQRDPSI